MFIDPSLWFGSSEMCTFFFCSFASFFLQIIRVQLRPDYCNNSNSHREHQCDTMAFVLRFKQTENVHYEWNSTMKSCMRRHRTILIDIFSFFYIIFIHLFRLSFLMSVDRVWENRVQAQGFFSEPKIFCQGQQIDVTMSKIVLINKERKIIEKFRLAKMVVYKIFRFIYTLLA